MKSLMDFPGTQILDSMWLQRVRSQYRVVPHVLLVMSILVSTCTEETNAGGFFLPQQSTQGVGRGFAGGAAMASDASTIFTNPAGMTELEQAEADFGVQIMFPKLEFQNRGSTAATPGTLGVPVPYPGNDGGNPFGTTAIPNIYGAQPYMDGRLWTGLGVTVPYGLSVDYDDGWFGRYDSIETDLLTVNIAPTIAYRINNRVSVGAGIDFQYADAQLTTATPNALAPGGPSPATDGLFDVEGDAWSVGFNLGILVKPSSTTRLGLHYRSGISHDLEGKTTVKGLTGPLAAANGVFDARADLDLPAIVSFGVAHELTPSLTLLGDFQWFDWSTFKELRVRFSSGQPDFVIPQNYQDSNAISIGAEYEMTPEWALRAGFHYDTTPTVDQFRTTSVPDTDNYWLAIGASYSMSEMIALDFAYAYFRWDTVNVDLTRTFFVGTPASGAANIKGEADNVDSHILSLNLRLLF